MAEKPGPRRHTGGQHSDDTDSVTGPGPRLIDLGNGEALVIGTAADFRAAADWLSSRYPDGAAGERSGPWRGPVLNMGAANALAAYRLYAGQIQSTPLTVLAYMALVSLDRDKEPHWWEGHETLSAMALGRKVPSAEDAARSAEAARERAACLRAVERAVTPLFAAGAITTVRHSSNRRSGAVTARYRLWLVTPAPDENRRVTKAKSPDDNRRVDNSVTRRKVVNHPTKNGESPDEKRRPKEYEEEEELDNTAVLDLGGTEEGDPAAPTRPDQDHDFDASGHPGAPPQQRAGTLAAGYDNAADRAEIARWSGEVQAQLYEAASRRLPDGYSTHDLIHTAAELARAGHR